MNTKRTVPPWIALAASGLALLVGCDKSIPSQEAGGSDEIDTRLVVDRTGKSVAGARIALVRSGDSTGKLAALSSTGSNGQYPSFNVPDGQYSATLRDAQDSLGKFLDTLQITGGKAKMGRDTLLALGKIRGVVRLVGGETPATVIMSLYGTDIAANVRKDGSFEIDLVPGGLFTLMGSTSLDGYGTLLRRLQLRDGQDLLIPDTLSLPVTGLLAPANIWMESDTGTGDVHVRWNKVDHPNRMGYVLEKLENGVVTMSQFLTDTVWKDPLSSYWEGLPLLGPWPSREAVYRVSTRPLSGKVDSRSVAQSFVAKAPEWTHRVDSVKVIMTTDSAAGVTTLKWNSPKHPDVVGFRVTRSVDGTEDCGGVISSPEWMDRTCPDLDSIAIDSGLGIETSRMIRVWERKSRGISYLVSARRRDGASVHLDELIRRDSVTPMVEWRDSVVNPSEGPWYFSVIGSWLVARDSRGSVKISKEGKSWETLEKPDGGHLASSGDSFWIASKIDTSTWKLSSRVGPGSWFSRTIQSPAGTCSGEYHLTLFGFYSDSGSPVFDCSWSSQLWKWNGLELIPFSGFPNLHQGWIYDFEVGQDGGSVVTMGTVGPGMVVYRRKATEPNFHVIGELASTSSIMGAAFSLIGMLSTGESVYRVDKGFMEVMLNSGLILKLEVPPGLGEIRSRILWKDELWLISEGHIWKGTFQLPK